MTAERDVPMGQDRGRHRRRGEYAPFAWGVAAKQRFLTPAGPPSRAGLPELEPRRAELSVPLRYLLSGLLYTPLLTPS